jgi:hypothetical protein
MQMAVEELQTKGSAQTQQGRGWIAMTGNTMQDIRVGADGFTYRRRLTCLFVVLKGGKERKYSLVSRCFLQELLTCRRDL